MGFYIRKSLRVGPVRFNLSKSGIGVSAGVRGLRVGTGPRGNYIHMGRGGLYYRATLPAGSSGHQSTLPPKPTSQPPSTTEGLTEIESGSVFQMTDTSSENLLRELNDKLRKWRFWPWVLAVTLLVLPQLTNVGMPESVGGILLLGGLAATLFVAYWDRMRRTSVLLYDMEEDAVARYQQLHDAFDSLVGCARTWHMAAKGATRDRKRNAGAGTLVQRKRITLVKKPPKTLRTNIDVPSIPVGRQVLCFFPDRLLVFDRAGVGAISYRDLSLEIRTTRFIENEGVPSDAQVVGQTWQYVNKNGGPDKRFKNNRQLPICVYEEIAFTSGSGLNEVIQISKTGIGQSLPSAVQAQVAQAEARSLA